MKQNLILGIGATVLLALVDVAFKIVDRNENKKNKQTNDILNTYLAEEFANYRHY